MPRYADDDDEPLGLPAGYNDDDGWNHDDPTPDLRDPGVYIGRIALDEGCVANLKPDGTGQVVFRITPIGHVSGPLRSVRPEEIPSTQVQRFSMYIARNSNRTINAVRKKCAELGSTTAQSGVGLKPKVWAHEVLEAAHKVHFTLAQRKERPGYPAVDSEGQPILEVTKIVSVQRIEPAYGSGGSAA